MKLLLMIAKECHLNNSLIFETANGREYSLISKFAFISVHSRFVIWASYLSENPNRRLGM